MTSEKPENIMPRLGAPVTAQFLGVFNDNAFKSLSIACAAAMGGGKDDSVFLLLLSVAYVLPFLIAGHPAGCLSDMIPKRTALIYTKAAELIVMLIGTFFLFMSPSWGALPLAFVMFLMTMQSAFFSPAYNGILPELFSEKEISRANGISGMLTFIAVILGFGSGFIIKHFCDDSSYIAGFIMASFSLAGLLAAYMTGNPRHAVKAEKEIPFSDCFRNIFKTRAFYLSVLGEAFFLAAGTIIQLSLVLYAKYSLLIPGTDPLALGIVQLAPSLGIGVGCYLAGRLSGNRVEFGLVPCGCAIMSIFLAVSVLFPGGYFTWNEHMIYPFSLLFLILAGIGGGLFVIPLKAYIQLKAPADQRGGILAASNVICFAAILFAGIFSSVFCAAGGESLIKGVFISPEAMLLLVSISLFLVTAYAVYLLPFILIRFMTVLITRIVYRVKISGEDRIPEEGSALLIANHVSFVDGLLISATTSRPIHFMMHEDYYRSPLLHHFAKFLGFIEVPSQDKPKKLVEMFRVTRQLLRKGELVCIFPEGRITRNGVMDEFKKGMMHILPDDVKIPIIPIRLGMLWGSIFSYYYGNIKMRLPEELPYPASVTVGNPVPPDTTPFALRQIISELAAETEMIPRDEERPIHYQFAKYTRRHPFRKIIHESNGKTISAFSMLVKSVILSRHVRRLCNNEKYIGVMLPNVLAAPVTILAVLMADKIPAVLNFSMSPDGIRKCMEKAGARYIITSRLFLKKTSIPEMENMIFLEDLAASISFKQKMLWTLAAAILPQQELMNLVAPEHHRDVFRTAVILFSSGSTGNPKGVMLSHHNISSDVYSFLRIVGWRNSDKLCGNLPLFHSFGFTTCFWIPMMTGAKVVYVANPLDGAAIGEAIDKFELTILLATPSFLQSYMKKFTVEQLRTLRLVVTGAEKLRKDIASKFKDATGLTVVEGFGCTELSPVVSINIAESILDLGKHAGKPGSVGVPMPGICVKIVDPASFKELEPGQEGLVLVKGPNVMQGYINDEEKTSEVLKDSWYNTGDIAAMDPDGFIYIRGRLSRFSKVAGEMVPHELIETAINEIASPETRCAAVSSVPDNARGERIIVLYTDDMNLSPENIIAALREKNLPNLWIPKSSSFYKIPFIPLLPGGKLNLTELRKIALETAGKETE